MLNDINNNNYFNSQVVVAIDTIKQRAKND